MGDSRSCSSQQSEWSPVQSRKRKQIIEVYNEVLCRLRELDVDGAFEPGFEDDLWAHFNMFPLRYALDVNKERAEDVLMHKKLLIMARDPFTRPAVDVRLVQVRPTCDGNPGNSYNGGDDLQHDSLPPPFGPSSNYELAFEGNKSGPQDENNSVSRQSHFSRPLHEITISTKDKTKLLSGVLPLSTKSVLRGLKQVYGKLTCLMSEIGLNIQEAHAFCTIDGYSLDVFVVDGWEKEIDQLRDILMKEIPTIEKQSVFKQEQRQSGFMLPLKIPVDGSDVWEIDSNLLKFEYKIAEGSNGDLYRGLYRSQDVAIKIFKTESDLPHEFTQEVYISRKVRHKNVIQFIGACTRPPLFCIVTEFMSGGSVYDFLHKQKVGFKLPAILKVAVDVSKGMSYLHQNSIIHRDLKAANLLMDENKVVKISDFGVARVQAQSGVMTAETGTYRWMAPEIIEHKPYDHKADVFSFGIMLWELLTGKVPYAHLTPLQAALGVVQKGLRPTIPRQTHPLAMELLERCWQQEPSLRPEFSEITDILQRMAKKILEEERATKRRNLGESCQIIDDFPMRRQENGNTA